MGFLKLSGICDREFPDNPKCREQIDYLVNYETLRTVHRISENASVRLLTIALSTIFLGEKVNWQVIVGATLVVIESIELTLLMKIEWVLTRERYFVMVNPKFDFKLSLNLSSEVFGLNT